MAQFHKCRNVRIEGVTFLNSPLWTIHFRLSEDILMDRVTVRSDPRFINSDGEFVADCTDSTPLVRKKIKRINITRPRPGGKRNLPNPTRSY